MDAKNLTNQELIQELKERGFRTDLLFSRDDVKFDLTAHEKDMILNKLFLEYYITEINSDIEYIYHEIFM